MIKNKILKREKFPAKIFFPPLVKAKNQHQNFEKHPKQKRCAIRRLNVPNWFLAFTKGGKSSSPEQIFAGNYFIFYLPHERSKLLASRIPFISRKKWSIVTALIIRYSAPLCLLLWRRGRQFLSPFGCKKLNMPLMKKFWTRLC